jgi:hypothetical protein
MRLVTVLAAVGLTVFALMLSELAAPTAAVAQPASAAQTAQTVPPAVDETVAERALTTAVQSAESAVPHSDRGLAAVLQAVAWYVLAASASSPYSTMSDRDLISVGSQLAIHGTDMLLPGETRRRLGRAKSAQEFYQTISGELTSAAQANGAVATRAARSLGNEYWRAKTQCEVARTRVLLSDVASGTALLSEVLASSAKARRETKAVVADFALETALRLRQSDPEAASRLVQASQPLVSDVGWGRFCPARAFQETLNWSAPAAHDDDFDHQAFGASLQAAIYSALEAPDKAVGAVASVKDSFDRMRVARFVAVRTALESSPKRDAGGATPAVQLFDPATVRDVDRISMILLGAGSRAEQVKAVFATPGAAAWALIVFGLSRVPREDILPTLAVYADLLDALAKEGHMAEAQAFCAASSAKVLEAAGVLALIVDFTQKADLFKATDMMKGRDRRNEFWRAHDEKSAVMYGVWLRLVGLVLKVSPDMGHDLAEFRAYPGDDTSERETRSPFLFLGKCAELRAASSAESGAGTVQRILADWKELPKALKGAYRSAGIRAQRILGGSFAEGPARFTSELLGVYAVPVVAAVDMAAAQEMWKGVTDWRAQRAILSALAATDRSKALELARSDASWWTSRMYGALLLPEGREGEAPQTFLAAYQGWQTYWRKEGKGRMVFIAYRPGTPMESEERQMVADVAGALVHRLALLGRGDENGLITGVDDLYFQLQCGRIAALAASSDQAEAAARRLKELTPRLSGLGEEDKSGFGADIAVSMSKFDATEGAGIARGIADPASRARALVRIAARASQAEGRPAAAALVREAEKSLGEIKDSRARADTGFLLAQVALGLDLDAVIAEADQPSFDTGL